MGKGLNQGFFATRAKSFMQTHNTKFTTSTGAISPIGCNTCLQSVSNTRDRDENWIDANPRIDMSQADLARGGASARTSMPNFSVKVLLGSWAIFRDVIVVFVVPGICEDRRWSGRDHRAVQSKGGVATILCSEIKVPQRKGHPSSTRGHLCLAPQQ